MFVIVAAAALVAAVEPLAECNAERKVTFVVCASPRRLIELGRRHLSSQQVMIVVYVSATCAGCCRDGRRRRHCRIQTECRLLAVVTI